MDPPKDLFKGTLYEIRVKDEIFTIELVLFIPKKVMIANIYRLNIKCQFILYLDTKLYTHSFSEDTHEQIEVLNAILFTFLQDKKLFVAPKNPIPYTLLKLTNMYLGSSILFHSAKHTFRITCKDNGYQYYLAFGGKEFGECIEIFVFNQSGKTVLSQVYSEKECGYDSILKDGETVDMIKSCLQVCEALFRTSTFIFHDNSQIDCGTKDFLQRPPRKPQSPYSLTHLHLMKYGKTWYEDHFNAELVDKHIETIYFTNRQELDKPVDIPFENLSMQYKFDKYIQDALEPFYQDAIDQGKTWKQFFRSIPKDKICEYLRWTPQFIDTLIRFQPNIHEWQIPIKKMKRTDMMFVFSAPLEEKPIRGGRKLKKDSFRIYGFSNKKPAQFII
jgi:hypothetical protein